MTSTPEIQTEEAVPAQATATATDVAADEEVSAVVAESTSDSPTAYERGLETAERVSDAVGEAAQEVGDRVGEAVSHLVTRIRNTAEVEDDERGRTTIADDVVQKIAGIAAREVPGVHDLGGQAGRMFASLREKIGLAESENEEADNGVSVRLEGSTATVELKLVIEFGYVVHSVTEAVRTKVISAVENMLGLEVIAVNIRVVDVNVPESADAA
jgi:uncharacterized alkaline shock family protein YloU